MPSLVRFTPVADLDVEGMATRYRWSGLGAPLAASTEPRDPEKGQWFDGRARLIDPYAKALAGNFLPSTDGMGIVRRIAFGTQLALTDPGSEYASGANGLPHNYYRFADQSVQRPHGCVVTDMAVGADGSVVVTRSNQGWGPNATPWRPGATGGSYTPPVPDVTITKINRDGVTVFEIDPGSNKFDGLGAGYNGTPHYNDINAPTFRAVAIDANGAVYAAGYQNPSGYSVARISSTGGVDWRKNVVNAGAAVSLSAIAVDPTDGNLIVCTPYNAGWDGATRSAHIFKLAASDGRIIWNFTATPGVAALAVAVSRTGRIAFGTDYPS